MKCLTRSPCVSEVLVDLYGVPRELLPGTTASARGHGVVGVENETAAVLEVTRFREGELTALNPWLQVAREHHGA